MARHGAGTPGFDPNNYVFYYFQNYLTFGKNTASYNLTNITQQVRYNLLQKQIANIEARTRFLINDNGEAGKALEELLNSDNINNQIVAAVDVLSVNVTPDQIIDKNLTMKDSSYINALADQLANDMSYFISSLKDMIAEMYQRLSSPQTLESYSETVIAQYAKTHQANGPIGQQILRSFLSKDGLKELNQPGGSPVAKLESDIQKCILLVEALPEFEDYLASGEGNFAVKSETTLAGQFFRRLFRKIAGLRAHAQGMMGEIAATAGLTTAVKKELKDIHAMITSEFTGSQTSYKTGWLNTNITAKEDQDLIDAANGDNSIKKSTNKKDAQINISVTDGNGVVTSTASFGASIKTYRIDPTNKFTTYTIHDSGSFANAYKIAFPDDSNFMFLYNLGAGHTAQKRLGGLTRSGVDTQWSQLIRTVAVSNLATALAGGVTENTLFMVLNGRVFLISDILKSILSYIQSGEMGYKDTGESFSYGVQIRGISRKKMMDASRWLVAIDQRGTPRLDGQSMTLAMDRSDVAITQLTNIVNSAKISISLRSMTSVILGN